jgi:CubicO group peptidase (beta-lactamase class C family)
MARRALSRLPSPIIAAIMFAAAATANPAAPARGEESLEHVIAAAMARWQVPGLAIAAARGNRVVVLRGFGVGDVASRRPVTPQTLFAMGSITKSFTVVGLAMAADAGTLDWDVTVRGYLPGFRLGDARLGRTVTLRDLVTHRSGMPRHDALWYLGAFDRAGLMGRLAHLGPAARRGAVFAHNNLMFMVLGQVSARLHGATWEQVTQARILAPLGMTAARLSLAGFRRARDRAKPYFPGKTGRIPIELRDTDAIGPAAAVYANARDMIRYVQFHLGRGRFDATRLLSRAGAVAMHTAQIATVDASRFAELAPAAYGMGFYVSRYRGRKLVYHPGVIDGYAAMISFMPDDGLGMIVLTNLSGNNPVPRIVTYAAYDQLLRLDPLPWVERFTMPAIAAAPTPHARPVQPDNPSRPPRRLAAYAGAYDNPAYGRITIRAADNGRLIGTLHDIRFDLVHRSGDDWTVPETVWPLREGLGFSFHIGAGGIAERLVTPLADGPTYRLQAGALVFTRAPRAGGPAR